jgi:alkanesulfonate monooxygenase SsuD/methylene tetrahydromethanopterin reductase-like flavin-dependent oxidoreductase (luciferase family)
VPSPAPFAPGSVSFRSYPNQGLGPIEAVDELRAQAALAAEHGFDGVMTSEHHGGFAGYLPNPLQLAGFLLDAMHRGWAAPCPLLLPLRPAALVAEETAWLAALFPGRVGIGVAAGALAVDFEVMGVPMDDLTARFEAGLELVSGALRGEATGPLAADPAIAACREHPLPVLSAAASATAARRAARVGAGLLFDSLVTPERVYSCGERGSASHRAPTSIARSTCTAATRPRARPSTGAPTRWSSRWARRRLPPSCSESERSRVPTR